MRRRIETTSRAKLCPGGGWRQTFVVDGKYSDELPEAEEITLLVRFKDGELPFARHVKVRRFRRSTGDTYNDCACTVLSTYSTVDLVQQLRQLSIQGVDGIGANGKAIVIPASVIRSIEVA